MGTAQRRTNRVGSVARGVLATLAILIFLIGTGWGAVSETLVFRASQSGEQTLDQGEGGGNPFASALVEILATPRVVLRDFPDALRRLTETKSGGFQVPEVDTATVAGNWAMVPAPVGERRIALVMVVGDYSQAGVNSLPGAIKDAERVAAALERAGFATETAIDLSRPAMIDRLDRFRARSADHDVAAIYTTGHGVEVDGQIQLLPGDYPVEAGRAVLGTRAISLRQIGDAAKARVLNLVFFGGCRDNPFAAVRR